MKKLCFLLTLLLTLLFVSSCNFSLNFTPKDPDDGDTTPPEEFTVFSSDVKVALVLGETRATDDDRRGYDALRNAITSLLPGGYLIKTDDYNRSEANPSEIVVGHTKRAISGRAYEYLEDKDTLPEGYSHFVIYCYDGAVAIAGEGKYAMESAVEYFLAEIVKGKDELILDYDFVDYVTFTVASYDAKLDAAYDAEELEYLEKRWAELEKAIGTEAVTAVRSLYDYYGSEWVSWIANLYDPKTGCIYYSNSARDNETVTYTKNGVTTTYALLPDCESTNQALDMLQVLGLFRYYGNSWIKALPEGMRVRCLAYIQAMQDPDDGYFYHPQWGSTIGASRRGRDLSSCLTLIRKLGGTPLYKTATERIEEGTAAPTSTVISTFMDSDTHKSSVVLTDSTTPSHLLSADALRSYIDRLMATNNCHGVGHILSSQVTEIKAAGLADVCIEHLDTYQNTETGYWYNRRYDEHEYDKISAIIKISALYSGLGGRMKYMDKVIDSAIETILSERIPDNICFVYNAWGGLGAAMGNVLATNDPNANDNTNIEVVRGKVFARFPEMIEATIEKLELFRKSHADGSFSFNVDGTSLVDNQGVFTSVPGSVEGDVNGTTVAVYYTINGIFDCLDQSMIPLLTYKDYRAFIEVINTKIAEAEN